MDLRVSFLVLRATPWALGRRVVRPPSFSIRASASVSRFWLVRGYLTYRLATLIYVRRLEAAVFRGYFLRHVCTGIYFRASQCAVDRCFAAVPVCGHARVSGTFDREGMHSVYAPSLVEIVCGRIFRGV